jgi:hypothetical protein
MISFPWVRSAAPLALGDAAVRRLAFPLHARTRAPSAARSTCSMVIGTIQVDQRSQPTGTRKPNRIAVALKFELVDFEAQMFAPEVRTTGST